MVSDGEIACLLGPTGQRRPDLSQDSGSEISQGSGCTETEGSSGFCRRKCSQIFLEGGGEERQDLRREKNAASRVRPGLDLLLSIG